MTGRRHAVHIQAVTTTKNARTPASVRRLALLCIVCSGGGRDVNGAYTLCALCELQGETALEEPAAAV